MHVPTHARLGVFYISCLDCTLPTTMMEIQLAYTLLAPHGRPPALQTLDPPDSLANLTESTPLYFTSLQPITTLWCGVFLTYSQDHNILPVNESHTLYPHTQSSSFFLDASVTSQTCIFCSWMSVARAMWCVTEEAGIHGANCSLSAPALYVICMICPLADITHIAYAFIPVIVVRIVPAVS